jgi:antimicrobial peptide system SdpB family protein
MLNRLGARTLDRLGAGALAAVQAGPWSNVYGMARTLLALGLLATLATSDASDLFRPSAGVASYPYCQGVAGYSLFCVMDPDWARPVAIVVLLVAASGWMPRFTALPQWWVTVSFQASATIPDGGDQVAAVMTLLLLPLALTDGRTWHWQRPQDTGGREVSALVALSALVVIRLQVAGIYLQASMAKLGREEWADGTALYYWLTDPMFGAPGWLTPVLEPVLASAAGVTLLTWGTVALEFALVLGLVAGRAARPYLLMAGITLHAGIAAFMGLGSFALAMVASLVLYLRPPDLPFALAPLRAARLLDPALIRLRGTTRQPDVANSHSMEAQ